MRAPTLPLLGLFIAASFGCTAGAGGFVGNNDTGELAGGIAQSTATYQVIDLHTGAITPQDAVDDLATNAAYRQDKMVFRRVDGGLVTVGAAAGEIGAQGDETPATAAIDHFYVAVFELTQGQWTVLSTRAGLASAPWSDVAPASVVTGGTGVAYPAWGLSRNLVTQLIAALPGGAHFALPSDVQWEASARGGAATAFWWGNDPDEAAVAARARVAETDSGNNGPAIVGSLAANPLGLHDVLGNVWELTSSGSIRGGSWHDTVFQARCANRVALDPTTAHALVGARLVLIP